MAVDEPRERSAGEQCGSEEREHDDHEASWLLPFRVTAATPGHCGDASHVYPRPALEKLRQA
jgi:hypothetical protein